MDGICPHRVQYAWKLLLLSESTMVCCACMDRHLLPRRLTVLFVQDVLQVLTAMKDIPLVNFYDAWCIALLQIDTCLRVMPWFNTFVLSISHLTRIVC